MSVGGGGGGGGVRVKGYLVWVLVLDWTQCLPQGVGAPPAMLRGRTAGFPKNWVAGPPERRGRWIHLHSPPGCGAPPTSRLYPFGASNLLLSCHQTTFFHLSTHFLAFSFNF